MPNIDEGITHSICEQVSSCNRCHCHFCHLHAIAERDAEREVTEEYYQLWEQWRKANDEARAWATYWRARFQDDYPSPEPPAEKEPMWLEEVGGP